MQKVINYYHNLLEQYGANDERSLGWSKHKQDIRFAQLFRFLLPEEKKEGTGSLLDIGCGFGDLYTFIKNNSQFSRIDYFGIDMMEEFIDIAVRNHPEICDKFKCCEFLKMEGEQRYDYCVGSGIFGHKMYESEDAIYELVEKQLGKALEQSRIGVAFDFLSDKVDYRTSREDFHASPEKILEISYRLSRRVIIDNSVMPFEFCVTIFKDDSYRAETTVFDHVLGKQ